MWLFVGWQSKIESLRLHVKRSHPLNFNSEQNAWGSHLPPPPSELTRRLGSPIFHFTCQNLHDEKITLFTHYLYIYLVPVFPFVMDNPTGLFLVMAATGFGVGANMGLFSLIIIDVMGLDNLAPVMGSSTMVIGIGFLCLGPFVGNIAWRFSVLFSC